MFGYGDLSELAFRWQWAAISLKSILLKPCRIHHITDIFYSMDFWVGEAACGRGVSESRTVDRYWSVFLAS